MTEKIKLSVQNEIQNVAHAMQRVTKAIFAGSPGAASSIKGKRRSTQFTFRLKSASEKNSIRSQARRQILGQIFAKQAVEVEKIIKAALEAVIAGLVGIGNPNVRVLNRSLGVAKPSRQLEQEPFIKFIQSKAGAGEIGLPDPDEALRNLKIALLASITVDVIVRGDGPQIKFNFDQRKLLKLTPHPNRLEKGGSSPFFSWLSLVTGPDFVRGGTPGFSLVRASDFKSMLQKSETSKSSPQASRLNLRRVNIVEGLLRASRTNSNAGEFAGLMMRNRALRGGKSPAETFGGQTQDYRPNPRFNGFWDEYWLQNKIELAVWSRRVISATIRALLRG